MLTPVLKRVSLYGCRCASLTDSGAPDASWQSMPDIMRGSGAVLREVGTTNRTRVADYAAAISDRTAAILRVHASNFRIEGFTERPALPDLVGLGAKFGVPVIEDQGSGWLGLDLFSPDDFPAVDASIVGVDQDAAACIAR